jgi:hypothetical protein
MFTFWTVSKFKGGSSNFNKDGGVKGVFVALGHLQGPLRVDFAHGFGSMVRGRVLENFFTVVVGGDGVGVWNESVSGRGMSGLERFGVKGGDFRLDSWWFRGESY